MSRQLIIIAKPNVSLNVLNEEPIFSTTNSYKLSSEEIQIQPLFEAEEIQPANSLALESNKDLPDFSKYYRVNAPDENFEELVDRFRSHDLVEDAYIKPAPELARLAVATLMEDISPPATPDLSIRQG